MFSSNSAGFDIKFSNGWTLSVQWNHGNYADNRYGSPGVPSTTAEVAAWDADGVWYDFGTSGQEVNFGGDKVRGYQTPEEVVRFAQLVASF